VNPESVIDKKCYEEALLRGGRLLRLRPPPAGIFDRLLLMPGGHAVFIEMKTATGQLNAAQREFKQDLIRMRVPWRVIRSIDEFVTLLDQLEKTHLEAA
jgi:hypothetical protein